MLRNILTEISSELDDAGKKTKDDIMQKGIDRKLSLSLVKYTKNLQSTCGFLLSRGTITMAEAISDRFGKKGGNR